MSDGTAIEWSDATWNFLVGCTKKSEGCRNCYAIRTVERLATFPHNGERYQGLTTKLPVLNWTGRVQFFPERLAQPLSWKKPRRIFVNSMSDMFHEDVPVEVIDQAFAIMALTPRHTYQVLTKRPERMAAYVSDLYERDFDTVSGLFSKTIDEWAGGPYGKDFTERYHPEWFPGQYGDEGRCEAQPTFFVGLPKPLPNVWLGTSTEDQRTADERIPHLLNTPAAVRFLSCEPLLGPIDLTRVGARETGQGYRLDALTGEERYTGHVRRGIYGRVAWVITGGESGPKARPMDPQWARAIRDLCQAAGVAFFHKQNGEFSPDRPNVLNPKGRYVHIDGEGDGIAKPELFQPGHPGYTVVYRVGKKAAGRLLDGIEWSQFPATRQLVGAPS